MALILQTTKQAFDSALSKIEASVGQDSPLSEKSFMRVMSGVLAMLFTSLYKFAAERISNNLAEKATGDDLEEIGRNYGVTRRAGTAAVVVISTTGSNGTDIDPTMVYVSDVTGVRYFVIETVTVAAGVASVSAQAEIAGADGNLTGGDTLTIESPVAGLSSAAAYTSTTTTGADKEDIEVYRRRVLSVIRNIGGGGNLFDYRTWAEAVTGVEAAYPYAGRPASEGATLPGDRTVYVQSTTAIQADGIAPGYLLDDVREEIGTDPDTGLSRPPLGLTDSTLFVEAITRTAVNVTVTGLVAPAGTLATVQDRIDGALEAYFLTIRPWLSGVDLDTEVFDTVTTVSISNAIQPVLDVTGSSASSVSFSIGGALVTYSVGQGELVKLGTVTYA